MVITAGFHGTVSNHVLAYVLPSTLIAGEGTTLNVDEACQGHKTQVCSLLKIKCVFLAGAAGAIS